MPEPNSTTSQGSWTGTPTIPAGLPKTLVGLFQPPGPPETPEQQKAVADGLIALANNLRPTATGRTPPTPHEDAIAERRKEIVAAIEHPITIVPPAPPPAPPVTESLVANVLKNPKFSGPFRVPETQKAPDDMTPWGEGE